ncbi:recombinase family protein [Candidatus Cryosericum septentrionale]|jgi:site-specific DNA recombinase
MAEITERKRAVIYTRVSSVEQTKGFSLETQERCCRDYAVGLGYDVAKVFVERGESAKTADRTELQSMLRYMALNSKSLEALIVYKVDRLDRNTMDHGQLKVLFKRYGLRLLSATESFDDTPVGKLMENQLAGFAQFDNDIRSERCRNGMIAAAASGRYVWVAPLGYLNGNSRNGPSLVLDTPEVVRLVRKSFELVDTGLTLPEARQQVTKEGLRTSKGKALSANGFRKMLTRKTYTGSFTAFEETVRGDFEAIVPEEVFLRVQPKLHRARSTGRIVAYRINNPDFPLRGAVRCAKCGTLLTASNSTGHGGRYGYYRCPQCGGPSLGKAQVEGQFTQLLNSVSLEPALTKLLGLAIDANLESKRSMGVKQMSQLKVRLGALGTRHRQILDKSLSGVFSDSDTKRLLSETEQESDDVQAQIALAEGSELVPEQVIKTGLAILQDMGTFWQKAGLTTRQQLQRFLFPEGIPFGQSGFGTCKTAFCIQQKAVVSMAENTVVAPRRIELLFGD